MNKNNKKSNEYLKNREILFKKQRKERGFSDDETWSLDYTLAKYILPRLKRFKEVSASFTFPYNETEQSWNEKLDKMIVAFELYSKGTWEFEGDDYDKAQEGIDLFAKHYVNLWW